MAQTNIIALYHEGLISEAQAVRLLCQCDPTLGLIQALDLLAD